MIEIKNAKITGTMLGIEDHGIMTFMLHLKYGESSSQGAGGYGLDEYRKTLDKRVGTAFGMELVKAVLATVGVDTWEELPGKMIRVKADHQKVHAIANVLEENWLDFAEFYETHKALETAT